MPINNNAVSIWHNEQPASDEYLQTWGSMMQAAFPKMSPAFWVLAGRMARKDGLSAKRLSFIMDTLCRTWKYPTLQLADIFSIDVCVKIWSFDEFYNTFGTTAVAGYCILADKGRDGKIQFAVTADAQAVGLKIQQTF